MAKPWQINLHPEKRRSTKMKKLIRGAAIGLTACTIGLAGMTQAATEKPNILVIMGDDIGAWNLSYMNRGTMGYMTPNIDRIAN